MSDDTLPQADQVTGAPHPRETETLHGHTSAETAFLDAHTSGRLHHAWLITGPKGIGKATLAWRIARFLAAQPVANDGGLFDPPPSPSSLDIPSDHPVWRRCLQLAEPRIALCRRAWDDKAKRLKSALTVDEVRKLKGHFTLSAVDGGRRVALIDAVDEMNTAAANALLKLLEEPPIDTVLLLICHQPARLLPTIRSRCRTLRLSPPSDEDFARALAAMGRPLDDLTALHHLTAGSVGEAVRLLEQDGLALFDQIVALLCTAPGMDRQAIAALGATAAGRANAESYQMLTDLTQLVLARFARAGIAGPETLTPAEMPVAARLCPDTHKARIWAELQQNLTQRVAHARAVNLDPEQVILDMFLTIEKTAAKGLHSAA